VIAEAPRATTDAAKPAAVAWSARTADVAAVAAYRLTADDGGIQDRDSTLIEHGAAHARRSAASGNEAVLPLPALGQTAAYRDAFQRRRARGCDREQSPLAVAADGKSRRGRAVDGDVFIIYSESAVPEAAVGIVREKRDCSARQAGIKVDNVWSRSGS